MASETLKVGTKYPVGTSVSAYAVSSFDSVPSSGAPSGSAAATATVASDSTLTFTGLTADTRYVAYASVSGTDKYLRFSTFDTVPAAQQVLGGTGYSVIDGLVAPAMFGNLMVTGVSTLVANQARVHRSIVPKSGKLRDLAVYVGTSSGNMIVAAYDTGDASAGSRTKLWDSGSVAVGTANAWQIAGDPNIQVTKGQHLDLLLVADNATATFGRQAIAAGGTAQIPVGYGDAPGGASSKYNATVTLGSFAAPATIAEASISTNGTVVFVVGRIS